MTNNVQQATRIESFIDWFADRREAFDGLLIDIDGTLTTGQRSVPRAAEFLQWLQTNDVPFFLVTNDCDRSHQQKADWLAERGIDVAPDELVSCGDALAACVDETHLGSARGKLVRDGRADDAGTDDRDLHVPDLSW